MSLLSLLLGKRLMMVERLSADGHEFFQSATIKGEGTDRLTFNYIPVAGIETFIPLVEAAGDHTAGQNDMVIDSIIVEASANINACIVDGLKVVGLEGLDLYLEDGRWLTLQAEYHGGYSEYLSMNILQKNS